MSKVPPGFSFSGTFSLRARTCAFFALFPLFTFPSIFVNPGTGCLPLYSIGPFKCERSPGQGGLVMGPGLYAPINSKVQHPPPGNPPGQPPGHLNFWRLPCSNSLPLGQESRSNAPTSPQKQISFSINTVHTFQREICRNDTFKLLLKTLLKELFSNKGEILSCKSVKPCKNRKNWRAYYVRTRDKSGSNSPPFQRNVQIPPSLGTMYSQMPGVCPGGGCWSFELIGALGDLRWVYSTSAPPHWDPSHTWQHCTRPSTFCFVFVDKTNKKTTFERMHTNWRSAVSKGIEKRH